MPIPRRHVLLWLAMLGGSLPLSAAGQAREQVHIHWTLPAERAAAVQELLDFEGEVRPLEEAETHDTKGVPLVMLIGFVVVTSLVDTLSQLYNEHLRPGLLIECGPSGLKVTEAPQLLPGTVAVKDCNGNVKFHDVASSRRKEDLLGRILPFVSEKP